MAVHIPVSGPVKHTPKQRRYWPCRAQPVTCGKQNHSKAETRLLPARSPEITKQQTKNSHQAVDPAWRQPSGSSHVKQCASTNWNSPGTAKLNQFMMGAGEKVIIVRRMKHKAASALQPLRIRSHALVQPHQHHRLFFARGTAVCALSTSQ